ncbi:PREDICTED: uncharacterized protein LOC108367261 [Rhagoletis zephyria]|uniref:uncharacterized protein LOC108367261 n=1 Tax=Rhagoletis zephyria TaxID=28612 RepID=UPI0008117B65|nr:PREDICTED: uncharacterized protein LOC108367261 [Rhagoletis zephyria]
MVGLKAENVRLFALLQSMHDDKNILLGKVESLQIRAMQSMLRHNFASPAVSVGAVDLPDFSPVNTLRNCPLSTTASPDASTSNAVAAAAAADVSIGNSLSPANSLLSTATQRSNALSNKRTNVLSKKSDASTSIADAASAAAGGSSKKLSYSDAVVLGATVLMPAPNSSSSTVHASELKQRTIAGSSSNSELKVADSMKWLHLSSFQPSVTADDIIEYVSNHANISKGQHLCNHLIKNNVDHNSIRRVNFKLGAPSSFYANLMSADLWPVGVNVRPFRFLLRGGNQQKAL